MAKSFLRSQVLFEEAKTVLVGGVDSPVRAFKSVGGHPIFMKSAQGPYLFSEDGDRYIDYVLSWGPHVLGHQHPVVIQAITQEIQQGLSYGTPSHLESKLAKLIRSFLPSIQKLRFVNSGTEATMSMIRLARGFTGRSVIVKFEGCYHGHVDSLLVSAGSGGLTFGVPDSAGILPDLAKHTQVLPYNDIEALKALFLSQGPEIAGVIIEPVCGNMGLVLPDPHFLHTLRSLCTEYDSLLLFDEVMTGFRVSLGGAQGLYGIQPDLTALGKVIGGGLPCGAYGGKAEVMAYVSPEGPVYQAGTLSGNPVVMAAGFAALGYLKENPFVFDKAVSCVQQLVQGLEGIFSKHSLRYQVLSCGTMFSLFFTDKPIRCLSDVKTCDIGQFNRYYHAMLQEGIYLAPSQFESNFMSSAHTSLDIQDTLNAMSHSILS